VLGDHVLDLILLALIVLFAVSGYRQGFLVGVLSFVGFVGGGIIGILIAPPLAQAVVSGDQQQALLAIVVAFLAATLGQLVASSLGAVLRNRVTGNNARAADAAGGAVVSALSLLVISWIIATLVAGSRIPVVRTQVADSEVLKAVNGAMPSAAQGWFNNFKSFVADNKWPQVFGGLGGDPIVEVAPPDDSILTTPALKASEDSIVKITGTAPSCQKRIEGTGFVFAPGRVMTNAHVVAGVRNGSTIQRVNGGKALSGRVVLYDPERDIAILSVPGLQGPTLKFDKTAKSSDSAIVAGFPKDHGFTSRAARIRAKQKATGPDIYHSATVHREIYSIRGTVEPGNSGGPLLSQEGAVYGVIFAAALDDNETGYALTAAEVAPDAEAGVAATKTVSTQSCSD